MFNEAFWFFYMVSIVSNIGAVFVALGFIGLIWGLVGFFLWLDSECTWRHALLGLLTALFFTTLFILTPPEEAFYAGAGQYVAESAEIDETLLKLKDAIDAKIDNLVIPEETSEE